MNMSWRWQHADISANPIFNSDFKNALGAIKAKAVVMPGEMDLYFLVVYNEAEVALIPNAACKPIPSLWGHSQVVAPTPSTRHSSTTT